MDCMDCMDAGYECFSSENIHELDMYHSEAFPIFCELLSF